MNTLRHILRVPLPQQLALALHRPDIASRLDPRAARLILLIIAVAILNGVDLIYTLFAHSIGELHEMNPLANYLLQLGQTFSLICYKILCVFVGCFLLWKARRSPWSLAAGWFLLVALVALSVLWIAWVNSVTVSLTIKTLIGTASRI